MLNEIEKTENKVNEMRVPESSKSKTQKYAANCVGSTKIKHMKVPTAKKLSSNSLKDLPKSNRRFGAKVNRGEVTPTMSVFMSAHIVTKFESSLGDKTKFATYRTNTDGIPIATVARNVKAPFRRMEPLWDEGALSTQRLFPILGM